MWTCGKCGERVEAEFEVCWKCDTSKEGVEDPAFREAEDEDEVPAAVEPPERVAGWQEVVTVCSFRDLTAAQAVQLRRTSPTRS